MTISIPTDVVSEILVYARDDKATLVAAATVARTWADAAQRELFRCVKFRPHYTKTFAGFVTFLEENPRLRCFIRDLSLSSGPFTFNTPGPRKMKLLSACKLQAILNETPLLKALHLSHVEMTPCDHFDGKRRRLGCLARGQVSLQFVTRLVLDHIVFKHISADPRCLIYNMPSLRVLLLGWIRADPPWEESVRALPRLPIRVFTICFTASLNDNATERNYTTRVPRDKRVEILSLIGLGKLAMRRAAGIINKQRNTLTHLTLVFLHRLSSTCLWPHD